QVVRLANDLADGSVNGWLGGEAFEAVCSIHEHVAMAGWRDEGRGWLHHTPGAASFGTSLAPRKGRRRMVAATLSEGVVGRVPSRGTPRPSSTSSSVRRRRSRISSSRARPMPSIDPRTRARMAFRKVLGEEALYGGEATFTTDTLV